MQWATVSNAWVCKHFYMTGTETTNHNGPWKKSVFDPHYSNLTEHNRIRKSTASHCLKEQNRAIARHNICNSKPSGKTHERRSVIMQRVQSDLHELKKKKKKKKKEMLHIFAHFHSSSRHVSGDRHRCWRVYYWTQKHTLCETCHFM